MTDSLLPQKGEFLVYRGSEYTLTAGKYYQILRIDYSVQLDYHICVLNDSGFEDWVPLYDFELFD